MRFNYEHLLVGLFGPLANVGIEESLFSLPFKRALFYYTPTFFSAFNKFPGYSSSNLGFLIVNFSFIT